MRNFWLFKSEPSSFSIRDLAKSPRQTTFWSGVRNYQARNLLRDEIKVGDGVLFYHSSADPLAIVGTARVVKAGYPDPTAFDKKDDHFDPDSDRTDPTWFGVDIRLLQIFPAPVTRDQLMKASTLKNMMLLKRGSRLSIQPVSPAEWRTVHQLAHVKDVDEK